MALEVVYCQKCGCPPEYCSFVEKKDLDECKNWLSNHHPEMFKEIYNEDPAGKGGDGDEEEKAADEEKPKKKGVRFVKDPEKEGII